MIPLPGSFSFGLTVVLPEGIPGKLAFRVFNQSNISLLSRPDPIVVFVSAFGLRVQGYQCQPWFRALCPELLSQEALFKKTDSD